MSNANTMTATYTKLKSGDWGLRAQGHAAPGLTLAVQKRDGTIKHETVSKVLWTDGKVSLCAILKSAPARPARGRGQWCEECGERATPGTHCWEIGAPH